MRGEKATSLYLVAQGRVRLAITTEDGGELSFRHTVVGEIFGEVGILDGGVRTADATALTPVTAYRLEQNDFHAPVVDAKVGHRAADRVPVSAPA